MDMQVANFAGDDNAAQTSRAGPVIRFGPFELNVPVRELREHGVLRRLAPQPFRVLLLLIERAGQTVSRSEIQHCLWGTRTYVEIDRGINFCLNQIRSVLRDPAESSVYIKTIPRLGYCFIAPIQIPAHPPPIDAGVAGAPAVAQAANRASWVRSSIAWAAVCVLLVPLAGDFGTPRRAALGARNSVLVADFVNTTGDDIFDDTLKEALTVEMRQSPFFDVLPDSTSYRTLKMMGEADARITPKLASSLCQRTGSAAILEGSIAPLGQHFIVSLKAIECAGGALLASKQAQASSKEGVLRAVNESALRLREALGESLSSLQKFDAPIEATTTSLEALKSYTLGRETAFREGDAPSLLFFQRAIELDPDFLLANVALAAHYSNLDQPTAALRYATKAYELRNRGREIERLQAMTLYLRLTGNLQKLTQVLNVWKSEYARDAGPYGSLGVNYMYMGQFDQAALEWQEALRRNPGNVAMYENLGMIYLASNRPADARAIAESAFSRHLDSGYLRMTMYQLGFEENDAARMDQQVQWAIGKPGAEDLLQAAQSNTDAYFGRVASARNFSRRAVELAYHAGLEERAATWEILGALREAEYGQAAAAKTGVAAALRVNSGRNVKVLAALALARAGDTSAATNLANDLERQEPDNTALQMLRMPSIRAAVALAEGAPAQAVEILEIARPYELGLPTPAGLATLYPVYLRGLAYLALRKAHEAETEFRKIIDNPGIAFNSPVAALARLGQARAKSLSSDTPSARKAYQEFLSLWVHADSDIPILSAAKAEEAVLGSHHPP